MNRLWLTVGLAAMDLGWVYPWSLILGLWSDSSRPRPLLSPGSILALVLVGALSTHGFGRRAAKSRGARLGLAALGGLAALLAVRFDQYPHGGATDWLGPLLSALAVVIGQLSAPALAFALGLYLWWRGVRLGSQSASYPDVEAAFRWGVGLLVAFGLLMALTTRPSVLPSLEAQTTPFVVGFFFVSLLTLALGRLESLRTRTRALAVNSQWLGVLVVVAGLVVLAALLVGQLVSFDLLIVATRPLFELLGQVLVLLLYALVIPLAYVVEWLVYLVLSLMQANPSQPPPQPPRPSEIDDLLRRLFAEHIPIELVMALKALGAALLVAGGLLIVARAVARWRPSSADADATNEERDSVFDAQRAWKVWLAWLARLLRRRATAPGGEARLATEGLSGASPVQLSSVRDLYRRLLHQGEVAGARRAPATTPLEHLPSLQRSLEPAEHIEHLTEAYVQARYAESEASPGEVIALRDAMERIHPIHAPD